MRKKQKIINLYDDYSISNIKHVISIQIEEDLHLFWEFLNADNKSKYICMNNFVSMFYEFAYTYILKRETQFFEIILEESKENFYFTFWNKDVAKSFEIYLQKTSVDFLLQNNRISIRLDKSKQAIKTQDIAVKETKRHNKLRLSNNKKSIISLPYTFITEDDLAELLLLNEDMQEIMHYVHQDSFSESLFISLRSSLSIFCLTIRYYDSISEIANSITEFSNTINTNKETILNLNIEELSLISGLINNIDMWLKVLFVKGGADLYFMDNSIKADCQMISQMFAPQCELLDIDEDLDDIFNF